jgi:hypothetical protein
VSGFPDVLDFKFPEGFTHLLSQVKVVNIDVAGYAASSCLMVPDVRAASEASARTSDRGGARGNASEASAKQVGSGRRAKERT